jgi:hypothetical protein
MPATMVKVLAAEMSDQSRLARGKRYHAEDAVIDIVIGHGAVTAEVRGSRYEPYVVTIETDPGSGMPARRELWVQCTCPDDTGTGTELCKHAVAAMFALSDELAVEPALVERWRSGRRRPSADGVAEVTELNARRRGDVEPRGDRPSGDAEVIPLHGRSGPSAERDEPEPDEVDPITEVLPLLLRAPAGATPSEFPEVAPIDHRSLPDAMVREILDDALDHLDLRWD